MQTAESIQEILQLKNPTATVKVTAEPNWFSCSINSFEMIQLHPNELNIFTMTVAATNDSRVFISFTILKP